MKSRILCGLCVWFVIMLVPRAADAQRSRWSVDVSAGRFDHLTELHRYQPFSFDNAPALGIGVSSRLMKHASGRVLLEMTRPRLSGSRIYDYEGREQDNLLYTAQFQVLGSARVGSIEPFGGAGIGLRRYRVESYIISDDIVHAPWSDPQVQPLASVLGGVRFRINESSSIAAEARWSWTKFRAAEDSWGLPANPVQTQREFQPGLWLQLSPW